MTTIVDQVKADLEAVRITLDCAGDHQTTNAQFLVDTGGGWLVQQRDLTPQGLSQMLLKMERTALMDIALKAKNMQKINATREVVTACEELAQS